MQFIAIVGAFIITLSLLSYGIGSIWIQRFRIVTPSVLIFMTLGVILDIIAVVCMYMGSDNSPFSRHSLLGYSAMLTITTDCVLIWWYYFKHGFDVRISKGITTYNKIAYAWWVIAYLTGSVLVIWK